MSDVVGVARVGRIARPWAVVAFFWICLMVASIDRQLIAITGKAIQADLHLSDGQLGFVQGPAFAFCSAFGGLPIGWLLDRANRVRVSAWCLAFWSATTSLTGLSSSFVAVSALRGGGAIGEAGLAPAALSIFVEIFPAGGVARASAIFLTAPLIGMGLGLLIGGLLLDGFTAIAPQLPGLIAALRPWQMVYLVAGIPGVLLAIALPRLIADPWHGQPARLVSADGPGLDAAAIRNLAGFVFGATALVIILYVQISWLPIRIMRSFGSVASATGVIIGPTYVLASLIGAAVAGWLTSRVPAGRVLGRVTNIMLVATALLIIPFALADLSTQLWLAEAGFFAGALLLATALSLISTPVQLLMPRHRRGRALAMMTVSMNIGGAGLGPLVAGLLSDRLSGHANSVGLAMAALTAVSALGALLLLLAVRGKLAALDAGQAASRQDVPAPLAACHA
jgi:MFS family permease